MKIFKKLVRALFNIIVIAVVVLTAIIGYNFFQISILDKQYSNLFGYTFFEVTTGSMAGTIEINDVILVKITKDVKKDDIISYISDNEIITHRIVKEENSKIYTKGDANNGIDKPIKSTDIIGKVIKVIPKMGIWIKVLTDLKVTISIAITVALFGIATTSEKKAKEETSFSRFMKNRREKKNGKIKEKKKS